MFVTISSVILNILLAAALLVLPGLALLRLCVPHRYLDLLCRVTVAPGITIALNVLAFTWCDLVGLRAGPFLPWFLIVGSIAILIIVRLNGRGRLLSAARTPWRQKINWSTALVAACLVATVALLLFIRFRATWGWCVPPGIDTEQHTMIVQLLMEHRGLFQSWTPYSEARTFTYHFGFHAIAATFGWLSGLSSPASVYIMGRVVGAAAAASLFPLVRLWTRSPWGGVFAVVFWEVASRYLYPFELMGRWTLLTGLTGMTSAVVLLALSLRPERWNKRLPAVLLCGLTAGGVVLTQYKSAIIFVVLAASMLGSLCLVELFRAHPDRFRRIARLACRLAVIAALAAVLAAPRLHSVMQARSGRLLKRIVLEAPAATKSKYDQPKLSGIEIIQSGFETPRKAVVSAVAGIGVLLALMRRRQALWFVFGWLALTVIMNPRFIGSPRIGLIDEMHWKLAIDTAVAAMAGLTIGIFAERLRGWSRAWNLLPAIGVAALALPAAKNLTPVADSSRYVLEDDLRLMKWVEQNVPPQDRIAGRAYFDHGEFLGRDGMMWLTVLTRRRTNRTNLASVLEDGPVEFWRQLRDFSTELYTRDMSSPEAASWMREQGFRWFYVGAIDQHLNWQLLHQLAVNPAMEVAHVEGAAWIYRVK